MMEALPKKYVRGGHRLKTPEETLALVEPHLASLGITRCADITGLDRIGIPVSCAIRPSSRSVQVAAGKGLRPIDARVSACMEAVEFFHAENPPATFRRASIQSLKRGTRRVISPDVLLDFRAEVFLSTDLVLDWALADDLRTGEQVWVPASAAYICSTSLYDWSTNGLASGNHLVEATLHGLYEVMERDAVSRLGRKDQVIFSPRRSRFLDLRTVTDEPVLTLLGRLQAADIKLVLISLKSCIVLPTFMAVLLDRRPFSHSSTINIGFGAHSSRSVAATRAITEAAQSRAGNLHGARENLPSESFQEPHRDLFRLFDSIEPTASWKAVPDAVTDDLQTDYDRVLRELSRAKEREILRVNMTRPPFDIPVVKVWISDLERKPSLF